MTVEVTSYNNSKTTEVITVGQQGPSGSAAILNGDVRGPLTANIVAAITGIAGIVAVHATTFQADPSPTSTQSITLAVSQYAGTGDFDTATGWKIAAGDANPAAGAGKTQLGGDIILQVGKGVLNNAFDSRWDGTVSICDSGGQFAFFAASNLTDTSAGHTQPDWGRGALVFENVGAAVWLGRTGPGILSGAGAPASAVPALPSTINNGTIYLRTDGTAATAVYTYQGGVWAPIAGGISQLTGDVTAGPGSGSVAATVVKVNGATVPAAGGALVTGNVLQVTGPSALGYGAVNLAGGSNFVTGTLPVGNLPNLAGDVTGAINANTVVTLTGSGGIVSVAAGNVVWSATVTPWLKQTSTTTAAHDFEIDAQTTSGAFTGGSIFLKAGTGGSANGGINFFTGSTNRLSITDTTTNVSTATVNVGASGNWSFTGTTAPILTVLNTATSVTYKQADLTTAGSTGADTSITAQNATGTGATVGGSLKLGGGSGATLGAVKLYAGATQTAQLGAASTDYLAIGNTPGSTGVLRLGSWSAGAIVTAQNGASNYIVVQNYFGELVFGALASIGTRVHGSRVIIEEAGGAAFTVYSGNYMIGSSSVGVGGGVGVVSIYNATTVPTSSPTGGGLLYEDGGAHKHYGSSGTITTMAAA